MDAAAGADVERSFDAGTRGERIENASGRRIGRDVVDWIVCIPGKAVGGEQQLADRQEPRTRDDLVADLGEPCRLQRVDSAPPECDFGLFGTDGELEEEEAHERRGWCPWKPPLVSREVASVAGVRLVAEQPIDRI